MNLISLQRWTEIGERERERAREMRGTTRLAMGVALAVAISLAAVFTLLLLLLADLFCVLRHRRLQPAGSSTGDAAAAEDPGRSASPLRQAAFFPFYGHGVLRAPTSLLLTIPRLEAAAARPSPPQQKRASDRQLSSSSSVGSGSDDRFFCISNPIFDGACEAGSAGNGEDTSTSTPFETPETSPSHLGFEGGEEEDAESRSRSFSPPMVLMKKLPAVLPEACVAVCLVDGRRSLATSVSATETNRASFSSGTPCSSPSW